MSFIDATCPKCGKKIGWFGPILARPPCPKCGYKPSDEELKKAQKEIDEFRKKLK